MQDLHKHQNLQHVCHAPEHTLRGCKARHPIGYQKWEDPERTLSITIMSEEQLQIYPIKKQVWELLSTSPSLKKDVGSVM